MNAVKCNNAAHARPSTHAAEMLAVAHSLALADVARTESPLAQHLNRLEERLRGGDLRAVEHYEVAPLGHGAMRAFKTGSAPACRTAALGSLLCADARQLVASINKTVEARAMSVTWKAYMKSLTDREQANASCAQINDFHRLGWKPYLFRWADGPPGAAGALSHHKLVGDNMFAATRQPFADVGGRSDPLPSEPEFTAEGWVAAAEGTYSFDVPGRLPIEFSLPGKTRDATRRTVRGFFGRIFQVSHLYLLSWRRARRSPTLRRSSSLARGRARAPTWRRASASAARTCSTTCRRWCCSSATGSVWLGGRATSSATRWRRRRSRSCREGCGGRAALVSSLHTAADSGTPYLPLALEATGARLVDTLFLGFWSFTEASPAAREHIDAVVKQLGAIAVSFNSFIQRMDNIDFLGTFARSLLATHSVCAWQPFRATHQRHQRSGGWLVAVHKARAPAHEARCVEALGCSAATKFPPEQILSSC